MMKVKNIEYGKTLRRLRNQHHIKQPNLIEPLNLCSQQQVSDLENGKKIFTEDLIFRICKLFGISVLEFLHNNIPNLSEKNDSLDEALSDLELLKDSELSSAYYKKLYIESKLENVEMKLKVAGNSCGTNNFAPTNYKIFVII